MQVARPATSSSLSTAPPPRPGMIGTAANLLKGRRLGVLWSGLTPQLVRSLTYSALRLGLYDSSKTLLGGKADPPFSLKLAAGLMSGALASLVSNPIELIKYPPSSFSPPSLP